MTQSTQPASKARANKKVLAIVLGLLVFAFSAASAASLGGIGTASLGADATIVSSCDPDGVNVDYVFDVEDGQYMVTAVDVSDIHGNCETQELELTVFDGAEPQVALADGSTTVAGATATVTLSSAVLAEDIEGIAIVISG